MNYELTQFPRIRYSMLEYRLFSTLPKDGSKVDSAHIAEARKAMGKWKVASPLKNVTVMMDRLIQKVQDNREAFRVRKDGKRAGHPKVEYWIESMEKRK